SPVIGPEHLGSLHTLGEIAAYLEAGAPKVTVKQPATSITTVATAIEAESGSKTVLKRSTVVPVPLATSAETIQLSGNGIIWVTDDGSTFTGELCSTMSSAGHAVRLVKVNEILDSLTLDNLSGLVIVSPANGTDDGFLEDAFLLLKKTAPSLRKSAKDGGAFFITVSRLDGSFAFDKGSVLVDPLSGGLAGLAKTAAHEWPEVACKSIDLGDFKDASAAARAVAGEIFLTGPVEVGLKPSGRCSLAPTELPPLTPPATVPLQQGDVVVVTGGGRGVTAATAIALAKAYRPTLILLGRSPDPQPEPEWLTPLSGESTIKMGILQHAPGKLTPKEVEERYHSVIAGRELKATLATIESVGGQALYRSVDIRDSNGVNELLEVIRQAHGPIRGIVHGAGVLADRLICDKTREQFATVYGTKVVGLRNLLAATVSDDLRFIALFGSTTGRFGRSGQVDYAVANEVLNKIAQAESRRHPACHAVCINWGPWDGGMVTPALKKVFSGEGIGLIGLTSGGELLSREIAANDAPVEVIALAGSAEEPLPVKTLSPDTQLAEAFSLTLSIDDFPFIRSHVIDGKAVLPMAVIIEWLAHGALHGNPGFRFHGFNDLRICKGVIFEQNSTCTIQVRAGRAEKRDSLYYVPVELTSIASGRRTILHTSAVIVLATKLPKGNRSIVDVPATPYPYEGGKIYDPARLFHGPELHGIKEVDSCSSKGISALVKSAPKPSKWFKRPLRNNWITDPLVMDCAFQLMILWSFERFGSASLPSFVRAYRQFQDGFPSGGTRIVINVTAESKHGASADMEFIDGNTDKLIARLEGYECVIDPSLAGAFSRNQLSQPACGILEAA
ncbi:MAG: SDR family NAD(P)-dependent oxidoreductase, partial [Desulfuromonadaceae bacterium]|nr:SDR family NAD(P)-dependent oxidoreductase [Desulfuromonadaceae bacterium]